MDFILFIKVAFHALNKKSEKLVTKTLLRPKIAALKRIVTPRCYNQPPLKRILSRDSKQELEGRKTRSHSVDQGLHKILHDFKH